MISLLSGVWDNELSLNSTSSSAFTWKKGQLSKYHKNWKKLKSQNSQIYELSLNLTSSAFTWKRGQLSKHHENWKKSNPHNKWNLYIIIW